MKVIVLKTGGYAVGAWRRRWVRIFAAACVCAAGPAWAVFQPVKPDKRVPYALPYRIDPKHSSVVFRIKHFDVALVYGSFAVVSGSYRLDPDDPDANHVEIVVDAASIDTRHEQRDEHLRGHEYLSTEQHGQITFKSKAIEHLGAGRFKVRGALTIRGVSKVITLEAAVSRPKWLDRLKGHLGGVSTEFTIKRTAFGMGRQHFLADDVDLLVSLESSDKVKDE